MKINIKVQMVHSDLTEAPKHDANNIVLFIQNACIKNNLYQYNYLIYNLISIFQQTLIYRFRLQIIEY